MSRVIAVVPLVLALALAGCGSASRATRQNPQPTVTGNSPAPPARESPSMTLREVRAVSRPAAPAVHLARTPYGSALVDNRGFALYLFTRDDGRRSSACSGACAAAWPPYIVRTRRHTPRAAAGTRQLTRRLGTIRRADGRLQFTYGGHPLYYYIGDKRPGEVLCQAVAEFGGTWYVVDRKGQAIRRTS